MWTKRFPGRCGTSFPSWKAADGWPERLAWGPDAAFLALREERSLAHPPGPSRNSEKKTEKKRLVLKAGAVVLYCEEEPNMLEKDIQEVPVHRGTAGAAGWANWPTRSPRTTRAGKLCSSASCGALFVFMADLCRRIDLPCTVDFMAVSSYGTGTSSSGQVQITKGPVRQHRGQGHPRGGGHSGLGQHPELPAAGAGAAAAPPPSACAPCWTSRTAGSSRWRSTTPASPSPTPLWWATVWTTPSTTAICPTLEF